MFAHLGGLRPVGWWLLAGGEGFLEGQRLGGRGHSLHVWHQARTLEELACAKPTQACHRICESKAQQGPKVASDEYVVTSA